MKKLLYIFIVFAIFLSACDPMQDIYDKIDKEQPILNTQQLNITLTADDYAEIGGDPAKYNNFSTSAPAADYLPGYFASQYPTFDEKSVINVTYNFYRGGLNYLYDLAGADSYELTKSDYDSFGTDRGYPGYYNNFDSNTPPEDYLPGFLLGLYPNAKAGNLVLVTYVYYSNGSSTISEFYQYNGTSWGAASEGMPEGVEVYILNADDYDSMGSPGKYNNFSSTDAPEDYLPQFLSIKFPYAASGDKIAVLYAYYDGSTSTKAKEYTKTAEGWAEYQTTIAKTDQYILTASGWIFDPTVLYEMASEDYQVIVDFVNATYGASYIDSYGTAEFYYGAGSHYSNFDVREGKFNSTFNSWEAAVSTGIQTALLSDKFPKAVSQVEGVDVFYVITFNTYSGTNGTYSMKFKCTGSSPHPTFEYVEGSLSQK